MIQNKMENEIKISLINQKNKKISLNSLYNNELVDNVVDIKHASYIGQLMPQRRKEEKE